MGPEKPGVILQNLLKDASRIEQTAGEEPCLLQMFLPEEMVLHYGDWGGRENSCVEHGRL